MGFDKKTLAEQIKQMERQGELQSKLNDSVLEYAKHMQVISELQKNITHISETLTQLETERAKKVEEIRKQEDIISKLGKYAGKTAKENLKILKISLGAHTDRVALVEAELAAIEEINKEHVEAAKNVNKVNLGLKEGLKFLEKTPGLIKKGYGKLKSYGLFEMDKSIRMAGVEMGKMASIGTSFGKDIIKASSETQSMGMHVKDLAKMQASYSSELGRSVMLSEEGFDAMSQMAKGTILGAEGAASLAAEMDSFNVSAIKTKSIVEDVTKMSETMGLNAGKVIKNLQNNLKMANKYHFKGGVKGMVKMAAQATKFNMSMETTAQFADKLFNIEGAVEMAARLNTMGGEWSKLGDPMKLMHQARNDMEGLQTSVIDATAGMADFNKTTGEFSFSGLELHRMKELEKITGISAEQMANMAKSKAKFAKIGGQMGIDIAGDPVMADFIENSATWNSDKKTFEVKLSGEDDAIPVKELTESHKRMMKADAANLKERAINSQSFDDQLTNMVENAKTLLLPLLEGMNNALPSMIKGFKTFMQDTKGIAATIKSIAKTIGNIVGGAIKLFMEFPKTISGAIVAIGLAMGPAKWFINGISLARGFKVGTKGLGGGAGGAGGGKGAGGGLLKKGGSSTMKRAGIKTLGKTGTKMLGGAMSMASLGGGLVGSYLGGMGSEAMGNEDTITGDFSSMLGGLIGGALGTLVAPGLGTMAGAALGAAGGKMLGDYLAGDSTSAGVDRNIPVSKKIGDGILADGKITPIDSKDKVFEVSKPGGAFSKAAKDNSSTNHTNNSKVHITFDTIKIKSDDGVGKIDLNNDSAFMSMLATRIKEELSKQANGGVLSPNPS